ncbi:hypothetical protein [Paenibacillus polysaccharolyticus]|uniref:hypothetical protein n=1 Tax=Paenibacillus polysaccharolyticus TaxID=582692 RepID=UPI00300B3277
MSVGNEDTPNKFNEDNAEWLRGLADGLEKADRIYLGNGHVVQLDGSGSTVLEGGHIIQITHELAIQLSERLREIADDIKNWSREEGYTHGRLETTNDAVCNGISAERKQCNTGCHCSRV